MKNRDHVTPHATTANQTELPEPFERQTCSFRNSSHHTFPKALPFLNILLELQAPGWDTVFRLHLCQCQIQGCITISDLLNSVFPCPYIQGFHSQSWAQLCCENSSSDGCYPATQASFSTATALETAAPPLPQQEPSFVSRVQHFIASEHTSHEATPVTQVLFLILRST